MFERVYRSKGTCSPAGFAGATAPRVSAGTVVPDSDGREHVPAAEVFKHALGDSERAQREAAGDRIQRPDVA